MAKRGPNQSQYQPCKECGRDTPHEAWAGPKDEFPDKSGLSSVDDPFGKGKKTRIYKHVRRCTECRVGFSEAYEVPVDEYHRLVKELDSLRQFKAKIREIVESGK